MNLQSLSLAAPIAEIQLLSVDGTPYRTLWQGKVLNINQTFNLDNVPAGLYFVKVTSKNGGSTIQKLMILAP